jgi:hypothetical protein
MGMVEELLRQTRHNPGLGMLPLMPISALAAHVRRPQVDGMVQKRCERAGPSARSFHLSRTRRSALDPVLPHYNARVAVRSQSPLPGLRIWEAP